MKTLCIIPARGGSKGVPKKNLSRIGDKTLLEHAAQCVRQSRTITRTVVSTDCDDIARAARSCGFDVPFMRPAALAQDMTTDWPVFHHCLSWLREHEAYEPDLIVHLRLTSPLAFKRTDSGEPFPRNWKYIPREQVIDEAVALLRAHPELDSMRMIRPATDTPYKMWLRDGLRLVHLPVASDVPEIYNEPRQKIPPAFIQNGYVDVTRAQTIMGKRSMTGEAIGGYLVACDYFVDIDSLADIELGTVMYNLVVKGVPYGTA